MSRDILGSSRLEELLLASDDLMRYGCKESFIPALDHVHLLETCFGKSVLFIAGSLEN